MLQSWPPRRLQSGSQWRVGLIEPHESWWKVESGNFTRIGPTSSDTANICGDYWEMEQLDILRHAVEVLERMKVPYMVVGSIASIAYGESRFTQDIDIIAAFEMKHVDELMASFPEEEFYLSESAVRDAIRTAFQFNVIHPGSGNKIDFMLPRDDQWGGTQMRRGRPIRLLPDRDLMIAAPEDVILGKLWYFAEGGGDRHLRDIAGILRVTGADVDRADVERWATKLGYLEIWNQIVAKVDAPDCPPGPGNP